MSLSPLLVATSSVENAVFSQYSCNNASLWRREGGEGGWTDVSGLSRPGGKRYRYTADSHTRTGGTRGPLPLKAAFCRPLIPFLFFRQISRTLFPKENLHLEISANAILQTDENIPHQDQAVNNICSETPRVKRDPEKRRLGRGRIEGAIFQSAKVKRQERAIYNYKNEMKTRIIVEKHVKAPLRALRPASGVFQVKSNGRSRTRTNKCPDGGKSTLHLVTFFRVQRLQLLANNAPQDHRETNRRDMYIPSGNETRKKSSRRGSARRGVDDIQHRH
ncbi:hypothetical protein ALC62_15225 [Cyphomyrmex costatus]|uniref:Uncharacterized protein n=1 Tax=Cyphomyrmex costatus TaxID=456900 RepID=A0A151I7Q4_9HYME|nr:hypothetical protein ALC62_15225 [Cyphomyrmex costatus]